MIRSLSLIVAMDQERGIGKNNDLMWHLPADMQFFKNTTRNHVVIMGRKNYESIPEKYRPLPDRQNIVLTRNGHFNAPNCLVFNSLDACLQGLELAEGQKAFIIGGGEIYRLALESQLVDELYITEVAHCYGADTFFPKFDTNAFTVTNVLEQAIDEKHPVAFRVLKYQKN
ncbi:MAG: hypothetical protein RLZZ301_1756 [Bacteroidota bacterium]|jgi:dihydrofolate reductase